jgi:hypothetical protein
VKINPYTAPTIKADEPKEKWRWRDPIIGGCVASAIPVVINAVHYHLAQGIQPSGIEWFDSLMGVVNMPGLLLSFFLGDHLAHPDSPVHYWNYFLIYAGTIIAYFIAGAGCMIVLRQPQIKSTR